MASPITLSARPRTVLGKGVSRLRREGLTPIVVYGPRTEPLALETATRDLQKVLATAGGTQLIALRVEGEAQPRMTLAKSLQRHVTRLTPLHADFLQVIMDEPITQPIPLAVTGEPDLARQGAAILAVELNSITVRALPGQLPSSVEADVSGLAAVGDTLTVGALTVPAEVEILDDSELVVARLAPPSVEPVEEAPSEEVLEPAEAPSADAEVAEEASDADSGAEESEATD